MPLRDSEMDRVLAERKRVLERRRSENWSFCELVAFPEFKILSCSGKPIESRHSKKLRYDSLRATQITRYIAQIVCQATKYESCSEQERRWRELALIVSSECVWPNEDNYVTLHKYASKLAVVLWMAGSKELYYQLCDCLETFANPPKLRTTYKPRRNTE